MTTTALGALYWGPVLRETTISSQGRWELPVILLLGVSLASVASAEPVILPHICEYEYTYIYIYICTCIYIYIALLYKGHLITRGVDCLVHHSRCTVEEGVRRG